MCVYFVCLPFPAKQISTCQVCSFFSNCTDPFFDPFILSRFPLPIFLCLTCSLLHPFHIISSATSHIQRTHIFSFPSSLLLFTAEQNNPPKFHPRTIIQTSNPLSPFSSSRWNKILRTNVSNSLFLPLMQV